MLSRESRINNETRNVDVLWTDFSLHATLTLNEIKLSKLSSMLYDLKHPEEAVLEREPKGSDRLPYFWSKDKYHKNRSEISLDSIDDLCKLFPNLENLFYLPLLLQYILYMTSLVSFV